MTETLNKRVKKAYIVAHLEDVSQLEHTLRVEGFEVEVVRGPYSEEQESYSAQVKCLVNHGNVWWHIVNSGEFSMVVEADFVPMRGIGSSPLPCPEPSQLNIGLFCYLYTCGPVIYGCDNQGHVFGHSASTVAYLVDAPAASRLIGFLNKELSRATPGKYRPWDTKLGVFLRKEHGILNYFALRSYGEHGGNANIEHSDKSYRRHWHRADILAGRLAFFPEYASGNRYSYLKKRLSAWLWGFGRLFLGRLFDPRHLNEKRNCVGRWKLARLAVTRTFFGTVIGQPKN